MRHCWHMTVSFLTAAPGRSLTPRMGLEQFGQTIAPFLSSSLCDFPAFVKSYPLPAFFLSPPPLRVTYRTRRGVSSQICVGPV